jgi:hypothetical protein
MLDVAIFIQIPVGFGKHSLLPPIGAYRAREVSLLSRTKYPQTFIKLTYSIPSCNGCWVNEGGAKALTELFKTWPGYSSLKRTWMAKEYPWPVSDLRIKFYAKWKEFIKEQAVDPDQPR